MTDADPIDAGASALSADSDDPESATMPPEVSVDSWDDIALVARDAGDQGPIWSPGMGDVAHDPDLVEVVVDGQPVLHVVREPSKSADSTSGDETSSLDARSVALVLGGIVLGAFYMAGAGVSAAWPVAALAAAGLVVLLILAQVGIVEDPLAGMGGGP